MWKSKQRKSRNACTYCVLKICLEIFFVKSHCPVSLNSTSKGIWTHCVFAKMNWNKFICKIASCARSTYKLITLTTGLASKCHIEVQHHVRKESQQRTLWSSYWGRYLVTGLFDLCIILKIHNFFSIIMKLGKND